MDLADLSTSLTEALLYGEKHGVQFIDEFLAKPANYPRGKLDTDRLIKSLKAMELFAILHKLLRQKQSPSPQVCPVDSPESKKEKNSSPVRKKEPSPIAKRRHRSPIVKIEPPSPVIKQEKRSPDVKREFSPVSRKEPLNDFR